MHAHIAEVFEIAGVMLARIDLNGESPESSWRCILAQQHFSVAAVADMWIEIAGSADEGQAAARPRRRIVPGATPVAKNSTYLVVLAEETAQRIARGVPVTVSVQAGAEPLGSRALLVQNLDPVRLQDQSFREALSKALLRSWASEAAKILGAIATVEPIERLGSFEIQKAVLANTGMVVRGFLEELEHREIRLVSGDLRSWTNGSQIARHPVAIGETHLNGDDADRVPPQHKLGFTAVIPVPTGQMIDTIYLVDVDASGSEATLYGPAVLSGRSSEQEGVRLVHEAFGPIQALPMSLIPDIYHPVLARPRGAARARRFEFGPPVNAAIPLTSIIIPFYGDAFFLNCVFHLQRVLGSGFELILVVDDPRIWPEVYGRLSASSDAVTVPTVLLECDQNYGYARANNLGAAAARGDVLILMNSDVMVLNPAMLASAAVDIRTRREARKPEAVIGFSLLYEDDTIQHVGMEFPHSRLMGGLRMANHPNKGVPFALYESPASRQVPAVTGALMALSATLFAQLGGLDPAFERRDLEDADLCLRARQMGAEIWLHTGPGLYHLERQSIRQMSDLDIQEMITYMNCVTFNQRWNAAISAQARSHDNLPAAAPTHRRSIKLQPRQSTSAPSGNLRSVDQKRF